MTQQIGLRRPRVWLGACALGLALAAPAPAQTGSKSTGGPPPASTTGPSGGPTTAGGGGGLFGGFAELTPEQDAALLAEATQLVDLVVTILGLDLTDEETTALATTVYQVLRFLAVVSTSGGGP